MFKYKNSLLPAIFNDFFVKNDMIHEHNTRQRHNLHVPLAKYDIRKRTIRYTGVRFYNFFQNILEHKCSIVTYKKHLKNYILTHDVTELVS